MGVTESGEKILDIINNIYYIADKGQSGGGGDPYRLFVDKMPFFNGPFPK